MVDYAAEDTDFIAKRMREIADERAAAQRNRDPALASGEFLDRIAEEIGEKRAGAESDYTLRARVIKKIGGEVAYERW